MGKQTRRIHRFVEKAWKTKLPLLTADVKDLLIATGREAELTADVLASSWARVDDDRRQWACWVCESFGSASSGHVGPYTLFAVMGQR